MPAVADYSLAEEAAGCKSVAEGIAELAGCSQLCALSTRTVGSLAAI